ncbi:MAG: hypothetical protein N3D14_00360 [Aquificaceae bacterium]|nr:hypothetical protein [Aquificaceae bacterium]
MEKTVASFLLGLLLGLSFVETTYRLFIRRSFYFLILPFKLLLWAIAFLMCYLKVGILGFSLCVFGFLLGFLLMLSLRGFVKNGRAESV